MRRSLPIALALLACADDPTPPAGEAPEVPLAEPHLRRLTRPQYEAAVSALLGPNLVMPVSLEPDTEIDGLQSIGAATTSVSAWGVERYEDAAILLAEQAFADDAWVAETLPCPLASADLVCAGSFFDAVGRRAWRRPLTDAERDRLVGVVSAVDAASGDFTVALTYGLSAVLQSPYFLYRIEQGEPDPDAAGLRRLTDWELATRLAFTLWNAPPDDALLDAVAAGELADEAGVRRIAEQMVDDPRFRDGVRALFTDVMSLYALDELDKDPLVFTHASPDLGPSAREETLLGLTDLVIDRDGDFRELLTTRRTFVDQRLAALYDIPAPTPGAFGAAKLPDDGRRRGLLGQAGLLALHAHSGSTSATLRGLFVRETLLCQSIPPPPAGLNTAIPEPDVTSPTLRDRLAVHMEDPACATCHGVIDPVGLGLENFDGIGRWRETENGATIDPSGEIDGYLFADGWDLAEKVQWHPAFLPCWSEHLVEYAIAATLDRDQDPLLAWYAGQLMASGNSYRSLMLAVVASPRFRQVGEVVQ